MGAGFSGIAAEDAVAAVVPAEVGQRQENLPRISDDAGLEVLFCGAGSGEQRGQIVVTAADQAERQVARNGPARPQICLLYTSRCV